MSEWWNDEVMTFYIQKVTAQLYCDIIMFYLNNLYIIQHHSSRTATWLVRGDIQPKGANSGF